MIFFNSYNFTFQCKNRPGTGYISDGKTCYRLFTPNNYARIDYSYIDMVDECIDTEEYYEKLYVRQDTDYPGDRIWADTNQMF